MIELIMKQVRKHIHLVPIFILFSVVNLFAQSTRSLINDGVEKYEKKQYAEAEVDFRKAVENDDKSFEGYFNLGDALYKQKRYEKAAKVFKKSNEFVKDQKTQADVFYNLGNSLLKAKKYEESIAAYKNSLQLNPKDMDAKYNLSYALKMLKQQQNQNKQNQQQQKQQNNQDNKDKGDNKNDENKNKDQNEKNKQNEEDKPKKEDEQKQQREQKPQQSEISKEEAKRILDALKNNEAEIQKQIRKRKGKKRTTEKDW